MDHVDIEVTDGSILIFTDEGDLLQMSVEPSSASVIKVMSSRPPSCVTLGGTAADVELVESLERMGHEVNGKEAIESVRGRDGSAAR
jgi:hypothetical protein